METNRCQKRRQITIKAIFALKSPTGEVAILNSGSDRKDIIDEFGTFLSQHEEVLRIFTAIRPQSIKRVCQNANIILIILQFEQSNKK